jgi:predicted nucleic acid-binding protein
MNNSPICLDAGLVIRRVAFPDDHRTQEIWENWRGQNRLLVAPGLLYYEVANVLYRYQRQGWLRAETVDAALSAALALPIEIVTNADLHHLALKLAGRYNLPAAYDAHYLAVTERAEAEFWTTDARLAKVLQPHESTWLNLLKI